MTERDGAVEVHGECPDRFEALRATFAGGLASGQDLGASVAVAIEGEIVVDLWGGVADADSGRRWERDTITCVWSSTKPMAALSTLALADAGLVDLDAPVARYWPEFAANGKDQILVRHVLGHASGVSGWEQPMVADDLADVERAAALLATNTPWWEPGSASGYHAVTFGTLQDELFRRVTGGSLGQWFRSNVTEPLGADFHIGLDPVHDERVATLVPPVSGPLGTSALTDDGSIPARTLRNPVVEATISTDPRFRRAEMPASNGHGNARSMALAQSLVSNGGAVGGHRVLAESTLNRIFEVQAAGTDLVLGTPVRFGMGFGITGPEMPLGPHQRVCYWGGWGGSLIVNDLDARMTFAYAMNRMGDGLDTDVRGATLAVLALQAVLQA